MEAATTSAIREDGGRAHSRSSSLAPSSRDIPYQETDRFCTWRKHTRNLYQQLFHIDLVWESPVVQLLPYITTKGGLSTHTLLSGTRTGGQEQSYIQLLSATMPHTTSDLDNTDAAYCEATGEVGGYGMASSLCGLKVERRILHDGDVLAARYMPANPLLIASASSNANLYVFDWSRVSLARFPNEPPRPQAPLPPNELTENPTEDERFQYQKRMRALNAVAEEQDRWDKRTGEGQHVLTLVGGEGISDNVAWSTSAEGVVASGSKGQVAAWKIANLSKDASRTVEPFVIFRVDDEEARVSHVAFSLASPDAFLCSSTSGSVMYNDVRNDDVNEIFTLPCEATSVALSPLDSNALLIGDERGYVHFFDLRNSSEPVAVEQLHAGEVTTLEWCPHSSHLFASGGDDGVVSIYNKTRNTVLFKHTGHTSTIMDLGWNWQEDAAGQLVSADANAVMMWRPRDYFFTA